MSADANTYFDMMVTARRQLYRLATAEQFGHCFSDFHNESVFLNMFGFG